MSEIFLKIIRGFLGEAIISVNISDEACSRFKIPNKKGIMVPVKHGMKVDLFKNFKKTEQGIVQGVAPDSSGNEPRIWINFESNKGATYFDTSLFRYEPGYYIRVAD